jgi:CspA family cold shock protein
MPAGTIKKLVQDKGFGFIATSDGTDVFFHHTTVADSGFDNLEVGQQVEFTVDNQGGNKGKGPRAASVTPQ